MLTHLHVNNKSEFREIYDFLTPSCRSNYTGHDESNGTDTAVSELAIFANCRAVMLPGSGSATGGSDDCCAVAIPVGVSVITTMGEAAP